MKDFTFLAEFLGTLSFSEGLLLIVMVLGGFWIYRSHQRELEYRQKQINLLAADNRDYRDRFERMLDRSEESRFPDSHHT